MHTAAVVLVLQGGGVEWGTSEGCRVTSFCFAVITVAQAPQVAESCSAAGKSTLAPHCDNITHVFEVPVKTDMCLL